MIRQVQMVIIALLLLNCSPGRADEAENGALPIIRYGYSFDLFAGINEVDALASIKVWGENLLEAHHIDATIDPVELKGPERSLDALKSGQVDILMLRANELFEVEEYINPSRMFCMTVNGDISCRFVLLVKANGSVNRLEDLKGTNILVIGGARSGMSDVWLDMLLLKNGQETSPSFFASAFPSTKPSKSILEVFFGKKEACVVTESAFETMVALNPQVGRKLKVLEVSDPLIPSVLCVRKGSRIPQEEEFFEALISMSDTVKGRQILTVMRAESMQRGTIDDLRVTEACFREYKRLKAEHDKAGAGGAR